MSTDYCLLWSRLHISELLDGRMENVRLHERPGLDDGPFKKCLTDGSNNFLWVHFNDEGLVTFFTRYAPNGDPSGILREISETLDVQIVSEHEPQFWGFETEEEWHAHLQAEKEEHDREFYDEVIKFIRGESNDIQPGTNGMTMAEIAKRLVAESPALLAVEKRPELIKAVETIFERDHCVHVKLSGNPVTRDLEILDALFPPKPQLWVKFIGYSAVVCERKNGHDVDCAELDFISGAAVVHAGRGWVLAPSRAELSSIVAALPARAGEMPELLRQPAELREVLARRRELAHTIGKNDRDLISHDSMIQIEPETNVNDFIREVRDRLNSIEQVLEQAEQIGSQITRRPYEEFIDEIEKTGLCRIEAHGFGVFQDGKLIYRPDYHIALTDGPNVLEVQKMPQKAKPNSESVH